MGCKELARQLRKIPVRIHYRLERFGITPKMNEIPHRLVDGERLGIKAPDRRVATRRKIENEALLAIDEELMHPPRCAHIGGRPKTRVAALFGEQVGSPSVMLPAHPIEK